MTNLLRKAWDSLSIYLPVLLMGLFALGTWWLVRSLPDLSETPKARPVRHEPDYFMSNFSLKSFDASGRLSSELQGAQAHHFPDTDLLEVEQVRLRSIDPLGRLTLATARKAISNADGTEVQLLGDARVVRERTTLASGAVSPRLEFRGEFLKTEPQAKRVQSHLPVSLARGSDRFTADSMSYDDQGQVLQLDGRVRGELAGRRPQ